MKLTESYIKMQREKLLGGCRKSERQKQTETETDRDRKQMEKWTHRPTKQQTEQQTETETYVRLESRDLSTEMVLQEECSSTLAVSSVASFTIPMYPVIQKNKLTSCKHHILCLLTCKLRVGAAATIFVLFPKF